MKFKSIFSTPFIGWNIFLFHYYVGLTSQMDVQVGTGNLGHRIEVRDLSKGARATFVSYLKRRGKRCKEDVSSEGESSQAASSRKKKLFSCFSSGKL